MTDVRTLLDEAMPLIADRLTAVIESRMSNDLAWLQDDGKSVIRLNPEEAGWHIAWLYATGDVVSGLPPLDRLPDYEAAVDALDLMVHHFSPKAVENAIAVLRRLRGKS